LGSDGLPGIAIPPGQDFAQGKIFPELAELHVMHVPDGAAANPRREIDPFLAPRFVPFGHVENAQDREPTVGETDENLGLEDWIEPAHRFAPAIIASRMTIFANFGPSTGNRGSPCLAVARDVKT